MLPRASDAPTAAAACPSHRCVDRCRAVHTSNLWVMLLEQPIATIICRAGRRKWRECLRSDATPALCMQNAEREGAAKSTVQLILQRIQGCVSPAQACDGHSHLPELLRPVPGPQVQRASPAQGRRSGGAVGAAPLRGKRPTRPLEHRRSDKVIWAGSCRRRRHLAAASGSGAAALHESCQKAGHRWLLLLLLLLLRFICCGSY